VPLAAITHKSDVSNGDFAQNKDESDVPSTTYLILSEVEGRTTPMQQRAQRTPAVIF
jgi:hypothetical protein